MSTACSHGHHHHHVDADATRRNIAIAFALNASFALVELFGGWWTDSVAIQADAIHDFGDSAALASALALQIISTAKASGRFNFGLKRLSLLSALGTSFVLVGSSIYILTRALERLQNPVQPHLDGMLALAALGVIVNGAAAWKMSHGKTQNEKALSWHMIEDLLGWVAVLVGSVVMRFVEAPWLDAALSVVIAGVVIVGAARIFWTSLKLFLQAAPNVDYAKIRTLIAGIPGLVHLEDLKAWSLDGAHHVATVQARISPELNGEARNDLKNCVRDILNSFGEFECTIELVELVELEERK
jgi:cobalt-zinc-cadmium efflux system protein